MSCEEHPELSIVVPVFNEKGEIAPFLAQLALQRDVRLELIVSDGGSTDGSAETVATLSAPLPFPVTTVVGAKGRGGQLNRGAELARARILLFLHVDSLFTDPLALRKGMDALAAEIACGHNRVAGRFALEFRFDDGPPPLPYRFYGAKATLDRPGCTHGDQGFMIPRDFFMQLSRFRTDLPCMEDTFLAERVREAGRWLTEGLLPRQLLNAILMNLAAVGRLDLLPAPEAGYRSQHAATRLGLAPFLVPLQRAIAALPGAEKRRFWLATGSYVGSNAWQIPFFFDLLRGKAGEGRGGKLLACHDRWVARLIGNRPGSWAAAALVWGWFRLTLSAVRVAERGR